MIAHLLIHLVGRSISVKLRGCTVKRPRSEHCNLEYIYQLRRNVTVSAYAWLHLGVAQKTKSVSAKAQKNLQQLLATDADPVGCPNCGWLQPDMLAARRKRVIRNIGVGMFFVAIAEMLLFSVCTFLNIALATAALIGVTALALAILVSLCALFRNMNDSAYRRTREALGPRCRAMPAHELDALLTEA